MIKVDITIVLSLLLIIINSVPQEHGGQGCAFAGSGAVAVSACVRGVLGVWAESARFILSLRLGGCCCFSVAVAVAL